MYNYTDTSDAVYYQYMEDFIRGKAFDTSAGEILRKRGKLVNGSFRRGSKVVTVKDGKVVNVEDIHRRADPRDDPRDRRKTSDGPTAEEKAELLNEVFSGLNDAQDAALKVQLGVYAILLGGYYGYKASKKVYMVAKNKVDAIRKARRKGYKVKEAGRVGAFSNSLVADHIYLRCLEK